MSQLTETPLCCFYHTEKKHLTQVSLCWWADYGCHTPLRVWVLFRQSHTEPHLFITLLFLRTLLHLHGNCAYTYTYTCVHTHLHTHTGSQWAFFPCSMWLCVCVVLTVNVRCYSILQSSSVTQCKFICGAYLHLCVMMRSSSNKCIKKKRKCVQHAP